MRYAGIIYNDVTAAPGLCLSFFVQGCPLHCNGCHNKHTWSFNGGFEFTDKTMDSILTGLTANGVHRTLCIMGGEPMAEENMFLTHLVINEVKRALPDTKIYLWSGYTLEELEKRREEMSKGTAKPIRSHNRRSRGVLESYQKLRVQCDSKAKQVASSNLHPLRSTTMLS